MSNANTRALLGLMISVHAIGCSDAGATSGGSSGESSSGSTSSGGSSGGGVDNQVRTVSGTVVGLTGKGLVITKVGSSEELAIAADGAFKFRNLSRQGDPYKVEVETQPHAPMQLCTVENGEGTFGTTNVTNVVVRCIDDSARPRPFTVGGTLEGFNSALYLEVQLNQQTYTLKKDGPFTFPAPYTLADKETYEVTLPKQPDGHQCEVNNGAGTINGANVSNVRIVCTKR